VTVVAPVTAAITLPMAVIDEDEEDWRSKV
jgi:hypothetical protein